MNIGNAVVLVTGANRGLGRELVRASLKSGARRVYATARRPEQLAALVAESAGRVVPLALDVTREDSLTAAAEIATDVTLLVNNAGVVSSYGTLTSSREALQQDFATNFFGVLGTSKAFLPALERSAATGAAIVNVLSVVSLCNMPALGGYSASKAATHSLTQALRAELAARNVRVHGVYAGAMDTDMTKDMTVPKTSPADVARAIVQGVQADIEDILPDPMAEGIFASWRTDPKALERQLASM